MTCLYFSFGQVLIKSTIHNKSNMIVKEKLPSSPSSYLLNFSSSKITEANWKYSIYFIEKNKSRTTIPEYTIIHFHSLMTFPIKGAKYIGREIIDVLWMDVAKINIKRNLTRLRLAIYFTDNNKIVIARNCRIIEHPKIWKLKVNVKTNTPNHQYPLGT